MATFKVFDPTTGQYVEKEIEGMTQAAGTVQEAVQPVAEAVQPVVEAVQQAAQPVVQAVQQAAQPVVQAAQPVVQAVQGIVQPAQTVPTIQVQPQTQQMPVMVQDPATGQLVQQMMTVQYDPASGTYVPVQAQPQVVTDPKVLAEQQKAAEKAAREAERKAKEEEAAARRARQDELREEAAERARRNDSVAGRVKNTAISSATRQIVSKIVNSITKAVGGLFGSKK